MGCGVDEGRFKVLRRTAVRLNASDLQDDDEEAVSDEDDAFV
jgi:hypothetical protein